MLCFNSVHGFLWTVNWTNFHFMMENAMLFFVPFCFYQWTFYSFLHRVFHWFTRAPSINLTLIVVLENVFGGFRLENHAQIISPNDAVFRLNIFLTIFHQIIFHIFWNSLVTRHPKKENTKFNVCIKWFFHYEIVLSTAACKYACWF